VIVEFDPDARTELVRASEFYEARRPGYGLKFIWAVEQATERASETEVDPMSRTGSEKNKEWIDLVSPRGFVVG